MNNLRKLRGLNGLSQEDLAATLGISRTTVSYWESNNAHIPKRSLEKICESFHCTVIELLGVDNFRFKPNSKKDTISTIKMLLKHCQNETLNEIKEVVENELCERIGKKD